MTVANIQEILNAAAASGAFHKHYATELLQQWKQAPDDFFETLRLVIKAIILKSQVQITVGT